MLEPLCGVTVPWFTPCAAWCEASLGGDLFAMSQGVPERVVAQHTVTLSMRRCSPLPPLPSCAEGHRVYTVTSHALGLVSAGSIVAQTRSSPGGGPALAVVVRTGFDSVKGRLVLSILHPKPAHFNFMTQSYIFVAVL